jgi:hypothetical protein
VLPLIFLVLGLLCSLASRALLVKAAFGISKKWGFGVFLPLGPLLFRFTFPDEARPARLVNLGTMLCVFIYILVSPELILSTRFGFVRQGPAGQGRYAFVVGSRTLKLGGDSPASAPKPPTVEERRLANDQELERLSLWRENLRLRKRDLLHSDTEGALAYNREATEYNIALEKANAEKSTLGLLASNTRPR